jgi:hypothetical protein
MQISSGNIHTNGADKYNDGNTMLMQIIKTKSKIKYSNLSRNRFLLSFLNRLGGLVASARHCT